MANKTLSSLDQRHLSVVKAQHFLQYTSAPDRPLVTYTPEGPPRTHWLARPCCSHQASQRRQTHPTPRAGIAAV